jgi:hypothetical protein
MKKETYSRNRGKLEDSYDESDDYSGLGLSEPKRRNKIQYDFVLWEE